MEVIYRRCAGLDVHEAFVMVCRRVLRADGHVEKVVRRYTTMTADLLAMADWLAEAEVSHVAMESTGVFWKPVWNLLEGRVTILLVNPRDVKPVPGRKTDVSDAAWIAQLLQHGVLKGSFVPPAPIRVLRDLTRHRTTLVRGETDARALADLAQRRLRGKLPQLEQALHGRVQPHHRLLLASLLAQVTFLEDQIAHAEAAIDEAARPCAEPVRLLPTRPGIKARATSLLAELGPDMTVFPSAAHCASWAALCPGHDETGGKRRSGKTRHGNRWLKAALTEAAWVAARTKGTYAAAQYRRLAARRGKTRAIVAVAHSLLIAAYHVMRDGIPYQDLGPQHFDQLNSTHLTRHLVKRLEGLGHKVTLEPGGVAA